MIAPGSDADIVVWNPDITRTISAATHHHAVDFKLVNTFTMARFQWHSCSIFEGMCCHGVPEVVLTGGRVVVEQGEVRVERGSGQFVPNPAFSPYVYDRYLNSHCTQSIRLLCLLQSEGGRGETRAAAGRG